MLNPPRQVVRQFSTFPRIDFKDIVNRTNYYIENARRRKVYEANPALVSELYSHYIVELQQLNKLREERNATSKIKPPTEESIKNGKVLKAKITEYEAAVNQIYGELGAQASYLPNDTHPAVENGEGGRIIRSSTMQRPNELLHFEPKDHIELGIKLNLLDFERAAKVAGSKFVMLKNDGVMLELALINYVLNKLRIKGFEPIMTPDLAHEHIVRGCGFQPRGESTQIYRVESDNSEHKENQLCLIGTSEIPLAGYLADMIVQEKELPIRLAGVSHCFRAEAGSAGHATKGLYRLHQFTKVEMFVFCKPKDSDGEHRNLLRIQEEICDELGFVWKSLDMRTEELGASAHRKFDVEVYMPGRQDYGEIASISNCTDYQSRRLNIRYRNDSNSDVQFVHTLNGTACAIPRTILALLETHQRADGSIAIPSVLHKLMNKDELR